MTHIQTRSQTRVPRGSAQNPDVSLPGKRSTINIMMRYRNVEEYMDKVNAKIGTDYKLLNYYGAKDANGLL